MTIEILKVNDKWHIIENGSGKKFETFEQLRIYCDCRVQELQSAYDSAIATASNFNSEDSDK